VQALDISYGMFVIVIDKSSVKGNNTTH